MPRRGENIRRRKDGRWEGRYIKGYAIDGKAVYGSVYGKSYLEAKKKQTDMLNQETFAPSIDRKNSACACFQGKAIGFTGTANGVQACMRQML